MLPLRILHVTPYFEGAWAYGGIPRLASAQARALARLGHQVTVCTTDAGDETARWPGPAAPGAVDTHVFPNRSNRAAYRYQLFTPVGLGAYLAEHAARFDVAHLHACHHLLGTAAARHLLPARVPYVLQPNGTAPRIERRRLAKLLFDATVGRRVLPAAARVIAVSEAERRQLESIGVAPARIALIPNPLDLDEFATLSPPGAFRARHGLGGAPIVLYLGKLTPRKRLDVLVAACAALGRPDTRLVIAGNDMGAGEAARTQAGRAGIGACTLFTGLLAGADRLAALVDATVVVYPSQHEVFGLVPLEALLCGTPVVVADDSGCGEIVTRVGGGLVVPQGDAAALARAIAGVIDRPDDWRAPVDEAGRRIREWYGADAVARALDALYREVVTAGPDKP
jgi:glycosyltransferase involved in cell wall biosynthesis